MYQTVHWACISCCAGWAAVVSLVLSRQQRPTEPLMASCQPASCTWAKACTHYPHPPHPNPSTPHPPPPADPLKFLAALEAPIWVDVSFFLACNAHFALCGGTLARLGNARHHQALLPGISDYSTPGCFAMTELAHGSNVYGIETEVRGGAEEGSRAAEQPCAWGMLPVYGAGPGFCTGAFSAALLRGGAVVMAVVAAWQCSPSASARVAGHCLLRSCARLACMCRCCVLWLQLHMDSGGSQPAQALHHKQTGSG
jgi:hypothetical protein